jgi:hypothetical protein
LCGAAPAEQRPLAFRKTSVFDLYSPFVVLPPKRFSAFTELI